MLNSSTGSIKAKSIESPLSGKTMIFLGSSVTYGAAAGGRSFVEELAERDGVIPIKEAVSGTVMVDLPLPYGDSYIARMNRLDVCRPIDAFICQLSTNDATRNMPLGQPTLDGEKPDTLTITGSIEHIICYARQTWHCPILFYTGTRYDSVLYGEMVDRLKSLAQRYKIGIIDLWNDPAMNAVQPADYQRYMADPIHPTRTGYAEWWTPVFERYLIRCLTERKG